MDHVVEGGIEHVVEGGIGRADDGDPFRVLAGEPGQHGAQPIHVAIRVGQHRERPVGVALPRQRIDGEAQSLMLGRAGLPQDQAIRRVIIQIVEHRRQHIGFRLADAAADAGQTVAIIGLLHIDGETANQFLAVLRPHHQAHRMRSIAQAAWRAVEGVAAAQRVLPVWESRADVLPGQAVMRLAQPLAVQQDLERTDAGARQHPTLDRQPAGDLLLDRIVHHLRRVRARNETPRRWWCAAGAAAAALPRPAPPPRRVGT